MSEIKVMASAAFREAYLELLPDFERASGHKAANAWAPSVQMMNRLKDGEITDLVILSDAALGDLMRAGIIAERFPLARSGIGVVVRSAAGGAGHPQERDGARVNRARSISRRARRPPSPARPTCPVPSG
ncbi:MAG: substrate-binding domain-containing protein [Betaproteobacteria bacterium]